MKIFKTRNFVEHTIFNILSFIKNSVFSEEYASGNGFLQARDPRIKAVVTLAFVLLVTYVRHIPLLLFLYLYCLILSVLSGIRIGFFLKRTWVFIPLFSFFIALPAIFPVFTPGEILFSFRLGLFRISISRPGLFGAILFVTRVATSLSFIVLLNLTTMNSELLEVLRIFRIPKVFVFTLGMCYRYIYLFVETIENTYLAIRSRTGSGVDYGKGQRIVAWNMAVLWQRSYQLNNAVYNAMLARGYSGEPHALDEFKTTFKDWLWLVLSLILAAALIYLDYSFKR